MRIWRATLLTFLLLATLLLAGCDGPSAFWAKQAGAPDAADSGEVEQVDGGPESRSASGGAGGQSMAASPFGSPKDTISHQYVLLRNGAVDELKKLFTEQVRDEITQEMVDELRQSMAPVSLRDLVSEVIEQEIDGKPAAVIKRKDGTTLTTLIKTGDVWQADTIWFK